MTTFNEELSPCSECHVGLLRPRHVTYFTWLGRELITVPHFPAWVCDVCGRREYDERAIQWLNMILDPNAGRTTQASRRRAPHPRPQAGSRPPMPES